MWETLGIAPTTDERAIRRAYALGLRRLDVERDAAGFARLRTAYEQALAFAARRQAEPLPEPSVHEPSPIEPAPPPPKPSPALQERARLAALVTELDRLLATSGVMPALARFEQAMAAGDIGLAAQGPVLERLMAAAVADHALSGRAFKALLVRVGWNHLPRRGEPISPTRRAAQQRDAAGDWWAQQRREAVGLAPAPEPGRRLLAARYALFLRQRAFRGNAALFIRDRRQLPRFSDIAIEDLRTRLQHYRHYGEFLPGAVPPRRLARIERQLKIGGWWQRFPSRGSHARQVLSLAWILACIVAADAAGLDALALPPILLGVRLISATRLIVPPAIPPRRDGAPQAWPRDPLVSYLLVVLTGGLYALWWSYTLQRDADRLARWRHFRPRAFLATALLLAAAGPGALVAAVTAGVALPDDNPMVQVIAYSMLALLALLMAGIARAYAALNPEPGQQPSDIFSMVVLTALAFTSLPVAQARLNAVLYRRG